MKHLKPILPKTLLPLLLWLLTVPAAHAQIPIDSIYQLGSTWTEYYYSNGRVSPTFGPCYVTREEAVCYKLSLVRDSLINGRNYHLLERRVGGSYTFTFQQTSGCGPNTYAIDTVPANNTLMGGLRVEGRKVYFFDFGVYNDRNINYSPQAAHPGTDTLLYDFDLQPGSSPAVMPALPSPDSISAVDSMLLPNGLFMHRYYIENGRRFRDDWWYEGIGSFGGLLRGGYESDVPPRNTGYHFLCFENRFVSLNDSAHANYLRGRIGRDCFSEASVAEERRALSTPQLAVPDQLTRLYPNPSLGSEITVANEGRLLSRVRVFDAQGRLVHQSPELYGHRYTWDAPRSSGLYTVEIVSGDVAEHQRLIVNR